MVGWTKEAKKVNKSQQARFWPYTIYIIAIEREFLSSNFVFQNENERFFFSLVLKDEKKNFPTQSQVGRLIETQL